MKYYKVKKQCDNVAIYVEKDSYKIYNGFLIGDSLLTENELKKLIHNEAHYLKCFDMVEVNKNKTHFFFGARFYSFE